jgi:hypothetical protein
MKTDNPIIQKYLDHSGNYSGRKSEERKNEIKSTKVLVQHFPIRTKMENGENMFQFGNIKF